MLLVKDRDEPVAQPRPPPLYRGRGDAARARAALERFVDTAGPEYAAEAAATRELLSRGGP